MYIIDQNNVGALYYLFTDHASATLSTGFGLISLITDASGNTVQELSFDACLSHSTEGEGKRRDPATWQPYATNATIPAAFIDRGFTFHEHLHPFTLINMNGRAYDPLVGRFLSADPYIQAPDNPQNLNRYSYCLNNPLRYSDPSGEWFLLDDAVVAAAGFAFGYVSYGISQGDWGAKAIGNGALGALSGWIGYNTAGLAYGCVDKVTGNYITAMALNNAAGYVIPPINIEINKNLSFSISPGFGISTAGNLTGGLFSTGTYSKGDWSISVGIGLSSADNTYYGGVTYYDRTNDQYFSYYATHFSGKYKQFVGGIGYKNGDFTLRWENDFWVKSGDKFRTNAIEVGIADFLIGTNLWTNEATESQSNVDLDGVNLRGKKNKHGFGAWKDGQVWSAPFYVGLRQGNTVTRIGYSDKWVQDRTQNFIHKNFPPGYTNFFNRYDFFKSGPWSYTGYYNPFTLY